MISVVIAAYNEEKRILESLQLTHGYLLGKKLGHEIIVVDDGSTDNTTPLVEGLATKITPLKVIRYEKNRGKGYAVRTGVLASTGDIVLITDADLSTPIEEFENLLPFLSEGGYTVAIGSRALAKSKILKKQPWWRQGMGKIFNRMVKLLVLDDFNDTQCGFKLFSGHTARGLFSEARIDRFAYDVEILALAKKNGERIIEVPVKWLNAPGSKVRPVRDSIKMFIDLMRIRFTIGVHHSRQSCGICKQ